MSDQIRWNAKYRAEIHEAQVNENLKRLAHRLKPGRTLDLAGGLGQNGAWLAAQSPVYRVINADISDEALFNAPAAIFRVNADVGALPFPKNCFDTLLNIRFYDRRIRFAEWLAPGGTVFFETFSEADAKYRPDFNPAHRFRVGHRAIVFRSLKILHQVETDTGERAFVTIVARKPTV